jgi:hypothetical protein
LQEAEVQMFVTVDQESTKIKYENLSMKTKKERKQKALNVML